MSTEASTQALNRIADALLESNKLAAQSLEIQQKMLDLQVAAHAQSEVAMQRAQQIHGTVVEANAEAG